MFFLWKMLRAFLGILAGTVVVVGLGFFVVGVVWMLILAITAIAGTPALSPRTVPSVENFFLAGMCSILGLIPVSIVAAYDEC